MRKREPGDYLTAMRAWPLVTLWLLGSLSQGASAEATRELLWLAIGFLVAGSAGLTAAYVRSARRKR